MFITVEGGDGCGKSTQLKLLGDYLTQKGVGFVATREPGGTPFAEKLRALVLEGEGDKHDALTDVLIFNAARNDHLEKLIRPTLAEGRWVLCDRFADSTIVYQSMRGASRDVIDQLNDIVMEDRQPDLTFVYDIDPEVGLGRKANQIDMGLKETRFEGMGLDYHKKVRQGFLEIAKTNPDRCVVIDATGSIGDVHQATIVALEAKLHA